MQRFITLTFTGLTVGAVYAAVALAIVIIWRSTRVLNFAQGAIAVASTYIAYLVWEATDSLLLAVPVAIVAGAALGAAIERGIMRHVSQSEELNPVLATFGIMTMITAFLGVVFGSQYRGFPTFFSRTTLRIGSQALLSRQDLFVLAIVGLALVIIRLLFTRTAIGLRMRAAALAPDVAPLLGVDVGRTLTMGWALAAAVGALAGVLVIPAGLGLSPNSMDVVLLLAFAAAVIGGMDSTAGAVVGGLVVGLVTAYTTGYLRSDAVPIVILGVLTTVLLVRPNGIFASAEPRKV